MVESAEHYCRVKSPLTDPVLRDPAVSIFNALGFIYRSQAWSKANVMVVESISKHQMGKLP